MENATIYLILLLCVVILLRYTSKTGWFVVAILGILSLFYLIKRPSTPLTFVLLVLFVIFLVKKLFFDQQQPFPNKAATQHINVANMTGYEYEQHVAYRLKEKGYRNVRVTRGSGDYGADIIATAPNGLTYSIQCKHFQSGKCGVKAVQEAVAGMSYYGCDGSMVITSSSFTPAAINMARRSKTILWDRFY